MVILGVVVVVLVAFAGGWALGGWRRRFGTWQRRMDTTPADMYRADDGGHEPTTPSFTWMFPTR